MSLYAGGIANLFGELALTAFSLLQLPPSVLEPVLMATTSLFFTLYFTLVASSMVRLHKVGAGTLIAANCTALVGSALISGVLPLPTLQLIIRVWQDGHFISPNFSVRVL